MMALTQDQLKRLAANSALDELKTAFSKKHHDPFYTRNWHWKHGETFY